jgi:Protein of unknown function (DUF2281)
VLKLAAPLPLNENEKVQVTVARLDAEETSRPPRQLGTMKGSVLYMAPDFDAPLEDFKEYME